MQYCVIGKGFATQEVDLYPYDLAGRLLFIEHIYSEMGIVHLTLIRYGTPILSRDMT